MKTSLIFPLFAVMLLISCEKEKEIDPREAYLGTWTGTETQVYPQLGTSETYDVTFMITKGTVSNEINIINAEAYEFSYTASVSNQTHTYREFHYNSIQEGINVHYQLTGAGNIAGKQINENGNLLVTIDGAYFNGLWYRTLTKK